MFDCFNIFITKKTFSYKFGVNAFKTFIATSNPVKHAALAGKARINTGTIPRYKPRTPSSRNSFGKASRKPFGYVPSGAEI